MPPGGTKQVRKRKKKGDKKKKSVIERPEPPRAMQLGAYGWLSAEES